mgnify:CR=1 FL=1
MKELTLRKIAEACHGTVAPEAETVTVTGVQSDSRRVRPGDLFVAIKGEKADGHDFVAMAASLGAKAALAILSSTTPDRFALAIFSQDEKALTAAPGVGKKLAQRILLELKDKLSKDIKSAETERGQSPEPIPAGYVAGDAISALMVLGYGSKEAARLAAKVYKDGMSLEETVREALRQGL